MNQKIVIVFEGQYHLEQLPRILERNGRDYPFAGNFENNEEMYRYILDRIDKGADVIVTAGGYYDYLYERLDRPVIKVRRSFATIALVTKRAREKSDKVGFLARQGILFESALKYKEEFNDPIVLEEFKDDEELIAKLKKMKEMGIEVLIVGSRGSAIAPKYGFKCIVVPFEDQDVMEAIRESERILKYLDMSRASLNLVRLIQNTVNEGIAAVDENSRITEINNYGLKILRRERSEVSGKHLIETPLAPLLELDAYQQRKSSIAELITVADELLSVNLVPVKDDQNPQLTVISFSSVKQVQHSERKLQERLNKGHQATYSFKDIIGTSPALRQSIETARRFARVDSSVLITAETGCGKEMFAQSIHRASRRRNGPFVVVNCAALPENLLESSLFGYEKGAFTGASREGRQGSFLTANGGTIFLDEVSEMPLNLQARFLRVLQEKEVVPLGSDEVIKVDVRVVAATNRNMQKLISEGSFRNDLYYRLAVLQLNIPNLNQRKEDIPELVRHFLYKRAKDLDLLCPEISEEALAYLQTLEYPGNIRQLQNITERILVLHDAVGPVSLDLVRSVAQTEPAHTETVQPVHSRKDEKEDIIQALAACGNNRARTAEMLGISTVTLWRKLKKYGLEQ
ncbi:MAG: sigma 54-interacting transcriptional regulator [Erysipelotrichaceae bacterium]|nr:sigma 54-interacting transcriptional regulator [Erysipelotrichaceae bacterium]